MAVNWDNVEELVKREVLGREEQLNVNFLFQLWIVNGNEWFAEEVKLSVNVASLQESSVSWRNFQMDWWETALRVSLTKKLTKLKIVIFPEHCSVRKPRFQWTFTCAPRHLILVWRKPKLNTHTNINIKSQIHVKDQFLKEFYF